MSEMIERVARAMAKARGLNPDANLSYGEKPAWQYSIDDARAALTEVRSIFSESAGSAFDLAAEAIEEELQ